MSERAFPVGSGVTLDELSGPDAAAALERLRAAEPVSWLPALDGWLVTAFAPASAVVRDATAFTVDDPRFSTARVVGPSMLSTDGAEHRRHRRPFGPPFRAAELEGRFGAEITELIAGLLARLRPAGSADLRTEFAGPLSVAVVAHSLGLADVDVPSVLDWYGAIVAAVTAITAGADPDGAAEDAIRELGAAVRARLSTDSVLSRARDELGDDEIVSNAAVMMFGGIETTEGMIANVLVHLLREPATFDRVRADRSLLAAAVEESLRLEPAAAVVDRYAVDDIRLADAAIARGDLVRVSVAGANRDPAVFPDPDRFDVDRENARAHLAFVRGPHACIAMDLARLETRLALDAVLDTLPGLRLTRPVAARGLVFRKPPAVPVDWDT